MSVPKKKFLYIRHAQTEANFKGIMAGGESDIPLNETGLSQASSVGDQIHPDQLKISKAYISPMIRTKQTAEKVLKNYNIELEIVEGFREWKAGEWEGVPFHDLPRPGTVDFDPPGGESHEEFRSRVVAALVYVLEQDDELPLIVAHGGVWHELEKELGIFDDAIIENAHLIELEPLQGNWKLKEITTIEQRDANL